MKKSYLLMVGIFLVITLIIGILFVDFGSDSLLPKESDLPEGWILVSQNKSFTEAEGLINAEEVLLKKEKTDGTIQTIIRILEFDNVENAETFKLTRLEDFKEGNVKAYLGDYCDAEIIDLKPTSFAVTRGYCNLDKYVWYMAIQIDSSNVFNEVDAQEVRTMQSNIENKIKELS